MRKLDYIIINYKDKDGNNRSVTIKDNPDNYKEVANLLKASGCQIQSISGKSSSHEEGQPNM